MNVPRSGHISVILQDGRVLVAGGTTSGGGVTNSAEIYDPAMSNWTNVIGGMVEARSGHTAAVLQDGRVLIAGG
jgi:N-acetylneuraminic acid mutarotase